MNFYAAASLKKHAIKVFSLSHREKITCISANRNVYGGFLGGVYRITDKNTQAIARIASPVSYIMDPPSNSLSIHYMRIWGHAPSAPQDEIEAHRNSECSHSLAAPAELSNACRISHKTSLQRYAHRIDQACYCKYTCACLPLLDYVIGDWDGNIYIYGKKIKVSDESYPIKYIISTKFGLVVHDSTKAYLVQHCQTISSIRIGAWPVHVECHENIITCITEYSVLHLSGKNSILVEHGNRSELLRNMDHTETITCLDKGISGSIGGWIMNLQSTEDPLEYKLFKIARIADKRITGISLYTYNGRKYYLCTTPNDLCIIDAISKKVVDSIKISIDNGLFALYCIDNRENVFVFDRNFKTYCIDISSAILHPCESQKSLLSGHISNIFDRSDTYEDLLKELEAGGFD